MASCLNKYGSQEGRDELSERVRAIQRARGLKSLKAKDRGKICDTPTDPSLEFDTFEYIRSKLTDAFVEEGRAPLEAAKIALYVVQGVRHVPKLLRVFTAEKAPTLEGILEALVPVLDESHALEKAKRLILHLDEEDQS
jgi:hypothetical protein